MKVLFRLIALLLVVLALAGCTSNTPYGRCVGVNGEKSPGLVYEYSTKNIVLSIIFVETVFVPVIVVLNELQCPVASK